MDKVERSPVPNKESPGPSRFVLGAKSIFDQNVDTTHFGFVTTEQAAMQAIASIVAIPEVDPKKLLELIIAQSTISDESLNEIRLVGRSAPDEVRDAMHAALIVQYEMEAVFPEVVREEEARFAKIRLGPGERWIGSADRRLLVERITRDRESLGLPRYFRQRREKKNHSSLP